MSWTFYAVVVVLGALVAWGANSLLAARRPDWGSGKRIVVSAMVAPALILVAAAAGTVVVRDATWRDLAQAAVALIGLMSAAISFAAGLVTAWLAERLLSE